MFVDVIVLSRSILSHSSLVIGIPQERMSPVFLSEIICLSVVIYRKRKGIFIQKSILVYSILLSVILLFGEAGGGDFAADIAAEL